MRRAQLKEPGITDVDLDRARWHVQHGTRQFRDFLRTDGSELTLGFARWLKDMNQSPTVNRSVVQRLASEFHVRVCDAERAVSEAVDSTPADHSTQGIPCGKPCADDTFSGELRTVGSEKTPTRGGVVVL